MSTAVAESNLPPFHAQPLFADSRALGSFPAPIADALATMVFEIEHSGEETTPDETSLAIEATFAWLGRVWVAEYLAAIDDARCRLDESLNRDLFERLLTDRPLLMGQWVGLARRIRAVMAAVPMVVDGLAAVDFGELGDDEHPVAKLIAFRNRFAHGAFHAARAEIREHRQLLHDLLARIPALRSQPAYCLDSDTKTVRAATRDWPVVETDSRLLAHHPIIASVDGTRRIDLYPMLHASFGDEPCLEEPSVLHPIGRLAEHEALRAWISRYERERAGHLAWPLAEATSAPSTAAERIRTVLSRERPGLVLLEVPPGCGGEALIGACVPEDPLALGLSRYSATVRVAVREGDPSQSGFTVACAVLRLVERALGEPEGSRLASVANVLSKDGPLRQALLALAASGKRALLALESLEFGLVPYRGEPFTLRDTYEALSGSAVDVVATCAPGSVSKPLYDARIEVPPEIDPDREAVARSAKRLLTTSLHRRVLRALATGPRTLELFELCDALEAAGGDVVFEPAVERALWDLRPILSTTRERSAGNTEVTRRWGLFSEACRTVLEEVAQ